MSTYELDDDLVRKFLDTLHESEDELPSGKLGKDLQNQFPIPAPSNIGAVVRTEHGMTTYGLWVLLSRPDGWVSPEDPNMRPDYYKAEEIGRIVEVLSEGVDL